MFVYKDMEMRWRRLLREFGIEDCLADQAWNTIVLNYSEPGRAYHTLEHVHDCLYEMELARPFIKDADMPILELAIWMHDLVYQPKKNDNEARSAESFQWLFDRHLPVALVDRVMSLVMATKQHFAADPESLEAWICDIDLWILGADWERFLVYDKQIRAEYCSVPPHLFWNARRGILLKLIANGGIYQTPYFRSRFEFKARVNIRKLLSEPDIAQHIPA
jgi:predicted metal-dependent HD superfamily phosphohydrolase